MPKKISDYRTCLMGLAILWVMVYHAGFVPQNGLLCFLKEIGYGGVDVFMLLSGLGVYCSLQRDGDEFHFYGKRLLRILPAFLPAVCLWMVLQLRQGLPPHLLGFVVGNLTGLSFWLQQTPDFNWYVTAILVFYLISPLLVRVLNEKSRRFQLGLLIFMVIFSAAFCDLYPMIAAARLPVYFLGLFLGQLLCRRQTVPLAAELSCYLLALAGLALLHYCLDSAYWALWGYGMWWFPFFVIAPALVFLFTRILTGLHRLKPLLLCLETLGKASFEIYLVHLLLFENLPENTEYSLFGWLGLFVFAIFCGLLYHRLIQLLSDKFHRRQPVAS